MDFTDDELVRLVDEPVADRSDLLATIRAELGKAPVLKAYGGALATEVFLVRIALLIQSVRAEVRPSFDSWVAVDRLRTVFLSACGDSDLDPSAQAHCFEEALRAAESSAWLEGQHVDEWRPGMRSGCGWVWKYMATPLGKRQLLKPEPMPIARDYRKPHVGPAPWARCCGPGDCAAENPTPSHANFIFFGGCLGVGG